MKALTGENRSGLFCCTDFMSFTVNYLMGDTECNAVLSQTTRGGSVEAVG